MQRRVIATIALVLIASTAPAALAANGGSTAYAGSTVSFDATQHALLDYSVGGATMADSIRVQSQSETDASLSLGASADLAAVTNLSGAALTVDSSAESSATVRSESGATMTAHDNGHGSLVVESGDTAQYVEVGLSDDASATAASDSRVVVTSADGTKGTLIVVGAGNVTVNDAGNVSADVGTDGRLVFRSYANGRTESDEHVETLIADGTAAASVSLQGDSPNVVHYDDNTTISVDEQTDGTVAMTVDRSAHDGKVVVTSVANGTFDSAADVQVQVDGEAAARASSYGELESAASGGESSKFMVTQRARASASADVAVAVNHFSTREVTMKDTGSGSASSGDGSGADTASGSGSDATQSGGSSGAGGDGSGASGGGGTSSGNGPGFGVVGALIALLGGGGFLATRQ